MWLWGCLAPHPPILVPAVGQGREREASATLCGMDGLADRLRDRKPDVLLVLSPHAPFGNGLMFVDALRFEGGLQKFGVSGNLFEAAGDRAASCQLLDFLKASVPVPKWETGTFQLDHASVVPLTWFHKAWGELPPLILANPIGLGLQAAFNLGKRLSEFLDSRRWALLASGDLSHRVTPEAPASYHPDGSRFDSLVMDAIRRSNAQSLLELSPGFIDRAGECGLRSVLALLGLAGQGPVEVLSYEAPFGVGYGTALWENRGNAGTNTGSDLPGLARASIGYFLETGKSLPPDEARSRYPGRDLWETRRACFVSLKNSLGGTLRGCIGTLEPTRPSLGEEILQNAISSATKDPRFEPVSHSELSGILISVDVLGPPERIPGPESLDPRLYGVIVERGNRRGVLLPDLEGIDSVEEQLFIASRKAGLPGPEGVSLWRFTVDRRSEKSDRP